MNRSKSLEIKIIGSGIIFISLLFWIEKLFFLSPLSDFLGTNFMVGSMIALFSMFPILSALFLEIILLISVNILGFISSCLLIYIIFPIGGIGIIKLRSWARYLILVSALKLMVDLICLTWISSYLTNVFPPIWMIIFVLFLIFYFNRKSVKEKFAGGFKNVNLFFKILIIGITIIGGLQIVSIFTYMGWIRIKYKELFIKPQKVEYQLVDKKFLKDKCKKEYIFDYSLYLPKDLNVGIFNITDSSKSEGHVSLFHWDDDLKSTDILVIIYNHSFIKLFLDEVKKSYRKFEEGLLRKWKKIGKNPLQKWKIECKLLKLTNKPYRYEKIYRYPTYHPFWFILKFPRMKGEVLEDVKAPYWKGFVRIFTKKLKDINTIKNGFDCSVYDLKKKKSANITFLFRKGTLTFDQVRTILATFKFEGPKSDVEFFEEGKKKLKNKNYTSAILSFLNACYFTNNKNPQYLFYLAKALFEESSFLKLRKGRLRARLELCKDLLEEALKIKPNSPEIKELLIKVNDRLEKIK